MKRKVGYTSSNAVLFVVILLSVCIVNIFCSFRLFPCLCCLDGIRKSPRLALQNQERRGPRAGFGLRPAGASAVRLNEDVCGGLSHDPPFEVVPLHPVLSSFLPALPLRNVPI